MGGCRCSYKNCRNTTKTTDNVHFFHYPVKQKDRCKMWIKRAEKPQFFDLDEYQLKNKVICEAHFEDHCFLNSQKKRLLPNAIPSKDGDTCYEIESAPSVPSPKPKERFKQFSTRLDDIQILPASEDGTIFVLDTFPSYKVSKEVKSYILNNDALLPLGENNEPIPKIKTEQIDEENEMDPKSEFILSDDGHINIFQKKAPLKTIPEPQIANYKCDRSDIAKKSSFDSGCHSASPQNSNLAPKNISNEMLESMICKTVESKYLHKLEQHTKDLNQIKKALRLSKNASKLNKTSVLRFLKLRLPPSLYTLVNLSIDDDYNLTEDDETFFKNLHDSSSRTYQFLTDDCNWRMPIIEIHEGDPDSMDDI